MANDADMAGKEMQDVRIGDPTEAEPGRGAPGDQFGVQTAQPTDVNAPDAVIPSNVDVEKNIKNIKAEDAQEEAEDSEPIHTTHGYVIDEGGLINNFAVEPQMYIDEPGDLGDQH